MGINERKDKQKAELRQLILDASVKLFSEHGFEGVSIRKIAELIEYRPTTIYLHFKDKTEILFELNEIGFRKLGEMNKNLAEIQNPLVRLYKLGENYMQFGLENPQYYDLMFMMKVPSVCINNMEEICKWKSGDHAFDILLSILQECIDKKLIKPGDTMTMGLTFWSLVHGHVALAIRDRLEKMADQKDIFPVMVRSLNWIINTIELSG